MMTFLAVGISLMLFGSVQMMSAGLENTIGVGLKSGNHGMLKSTSAKMERPKSLHGPKNVAHLTNSSSNCLWECGRPQELNVYSPWLAWRATMADYEE